MMMASLLYSLYALKSRRLRNLILRRVAHMEGGEMSSPTLRKIFRNYHDIDIGIYSYGCFAVKNIPAGTIIGRYCSFASGVNVLSGNHPLTHKSLHPFFYNPVFGHVNDLLITRTKLVVENDVWIGQNAIILPSVDKIENGAVIGAGAVVSKNVPPFAVVAGNPARVIKYRFSQQVIDQILKSGWWEKDIEDLKNNRSEFKSFLRPFE